MGGIYLINEPVALVQLSSMDKDYSCNMVSAMSNLLLLSLFVFCLYNFVCFFFISHYFLS